MSRQLLVGQEYAVLRFVDLRIGDSNLSQPEGRLIFKRSCNCGRWPEAKEFGTAAFSLLLNLDDIKGNWKLMFPIVCGSAQFTFLSYLRHSIVTQWIYFISK